MKQVIKVKWLAQVHNTLALVGLQLTTFVPLYYESCIFPLDHTRPIRVSYMYTIKIVCMRFWYNLIFFLIIT